MALNHSKGFSQPGNLASASQASAYEGMEPGNILHLHLPPDRVKRYTNAHLEERILKF